MFKTADIKPFYSSKDYDQKKSGQQKTLPILEKSMVSSIMATYSSPSSNSSSAYKYAESNQDHPKSKSNSPVYQAQSTNGYHQTYYANVANSTGTANSMLNGAIKVSLNSKNLNN